MRYVIYGAGGIGGGIAGRLERAGCDVVAIARGEHLRVMQAQGLRVRTPDGEWTSKLAAVGHPSDVDWRADDGDVCILAMKSQDTPAALVELEAAAGPDLPVVCAQNGVDNERMARRLFERVYAMLVVFPATFLEPGQVDLHGTPLSGLLDAGRYPDGVDDVIRQVCADLSEAGFLARPTERAMRLKYGKLLGNLGNALQALCGPESARDGAGRDFMRRLQAEAIECYDAAGIDYATNDEIAELRGQAFHWGEIAGTQRGGGSTWQSFARGLPSIETDYLNGEIVLLGALSGVPTPYNRVLQVAAKRAHREAAGPGAYAIEQLQALVDEAELLEELDV